MVKAYEGVYPIILQSCFIADSADVIGKVNIGENSNIWYNCVLRGDHNHILIGKNSNIQDGCVVHNSKNTSTEVGDYVTVGHKAILHGCKVGDYSLIGMGAIVLDGAEIGEYTLIGAGSLVPPGKKIPSGVLAYGNPVKVIRELSQEEKNMLEKSAIEYVQFAKKHK